MARKASTTYYPTLHLEIARYIAFAGKAGYELPWAISRFIGSPPAGMRKPGSSSRRASRATNSPYGSLPPSPTKRNGVVGAPPVPLLPQPRKVTPMFGGSSPNVS